MEMFTCYVIGHDDVALECANLLNEFGHRIVGFVTDCGKNKNWCLNEHIPVTSLANIVNSKSGVEKVDYVFHLSNEDLNPEIDFLVSKFILKIKNPFSLNTTKKYQFNHLLQGIYLQGAWIASTYNKETVLCCFKILIDNNENIASLKNKYNEEAVNSLSELIVKLSRQDYSTECDIFYDKAISGQHFAEKIKSFSINYSCSEMSIMVSLFLIFINRYNLTKSSHISVSNVLTYFVPNAFVSKPILQVDLANCTFNTVVKKIQDICHELSGKSLSLNGWLEFHNEEANILFREQNDNNPQLFEGIMQSNIQMDFDSENYTIGIHVNSDLNKTYHLKTLSHNLELLFSTLLVAPDENIFSLPMVCEIESMILNEYSIPENIPQNSITLHQGFEAIAQSSPLKTALYFENESLTYFELNQKANKLAHYIRKYYLQTYSKELGKNEPISICVDRGLVMIISILAVLKTGATYVPLDPSNPKERLAYIIKDSKTSILITQTHLIQNFNGIPIIDINQDKDLISESINGNINVQTHVSDIAYIIYTSGSTGQPKGVMVPHQGACNMVLWTINYYPITYEDVLIQIASYAFDFSVWEIFAALMSGASLVLTASEKYKDPYYLLNLMISKKVSVLGGVPTLFKVLLSCKEIQKLKTLKNAVCGAEPLTEDLCHKFFSLFNAKLYHGYGPTETSITSTHWVCTQKNYRQGIFIGRPIANTYLYVLDEYQRQVPLGVAGELHIGGQGVAKGYVNKNQLTIERFILNPFQETRAPVLYKTGDLVRWTPDGNLQFLGRVDHQIKLRGFRIELLEIEHTIKQLSDIQDCVVVINSINDTSYLIAYYVIYIQNSNTKHKLYEHLRKTLPYYMIPSYFVEMKSLPLTPSGKIDRKNLPVPNQKQDLIYEGYIAPNTEIEKILTTTIELILNLEKVGLLDNFFCLGGNSLTATQVISKLNNLLNLHCTVADLFKYPIVSDLAYYLDSLEENLDLSYQVKIISRDNMQPLSFAQQRIWFMYQYEEQKSSTYNIPIAYELIGNIDVSMLENTFNILIKRHESLRTIFKNVNGIPQQVIIKPYCIKLVCELINPDSLQNILEQESHKSFKLEDEPAIRIKLYQVSHNKHILFINQHNIITDGWSIGVLIKEINDTYTSLIEGSHLNLAKLPFQYIDFALWQREYLTNLSFNKQLQFWQKYLHQFTEVILKTDKPRPKTQTYVGDHLKYEFPIDLVKKIDQLAQKNNVTLFMVLIGALSIVLHRYTGNEDIVIGSGIAGRNRKDIENLLGFFVNTLAIRTSLAGNPSFTDFLQLVKESCLGVYENQDIPFEILVDKLKINREPDRTPVFQIMFLLQDTNNNVSLHLPEIISKRLDIIQKIAMFDITFNVTKTDKDLIFDVQYNTDLFFRNTIEHLCKHIHILLEDIIKSPDNTIYSYNILSENQLQAIFTKWNSTKVNFPIQKTIIELFLENIEETFDHEAIIAHSGKLTYCELINKINTISSALQKREDITSKNSLIGVCLSRDIFLIPGILGVLKAGMTYIPLDPDYPHKRLQYMLDNACIKTIITETTLLNKISIFNNKKYDIICIDTLTDTSVQTPAIQDSNNLAYVIFTSGSTGQPKGVMIENTSVVNLVYDIQRRLNFTKNDSFLSLTSISFDIFGLEMLLPLLFKGKVILCPPCMTKDPEQLMQHIIKHKPSVIQATPSTWGMIVDLLLENNITQRFDILCGGEPLDKKLAFKLQKIAKRFFNVYGPAETTIWSTINEIKMGEISIGQPISNTYCFVLDNHLNLVPPGMPGELYIGGIGVARGYINNPSLTNARFIPNPFGKQMDINLSPKLYKTGDIVTLRCDGKFNYIGRNDEQIKIRGYRIETEEINSILNAYDKIKSAIVVIKKYENDEMQIIAYFVPKESAKINIDNLRHYMSTYLPDYMIPAHFVRMEAFPLNSNNKIDKFSLPVIENTLATKTESYIEPKTAMQILMANVWKKTLRLDKVSIEASFFALGGHSLLIPQIIVELNTHFDVKLTIRDFIQNLTIEKLSKIIENFQVIEQAEA